MSPPVGPTGLTQSCDGDHPARNFRVGGTLGSFDTTIVFGERRARLRQEAVAISLDRRMSPRATVQLALGAVFAGRLTPNDAGGREHPLAGALVSIAGSYRLVDEKGSRPFVIGTGSLGQSLLAVGPSGSGATLAATDARIGLVVGKSFANLIAPFAVVRAFFGPVRWSSGDETRVGSDRYHYNVGVGTLLLAGGGVDGSIEVSFLGERRVTTGLGYSF